MEGYKLSHGVLVSPNKMLRMHWAVRRKLKREIIAELELRVMPFLMKNEIPFKKCHIVVERHISGRHKFMDPDNLVGSMKMLIDAMRDLGIIDDDTPEHVVITARQERSESDFNGVCLLLNELAEK
jgi:hypothetical protein